MAPVPITDDLYKILELEQTATNKDVVQSYKRLALKLHPDRNANDTTAAFQRLAIAYETLKDESKRRAYDSIYPTISRNGSSTSTPNVSRPAPTSKPHSGTPSEVVQIAALQKSKQERGARWQSSKSIFDSSIYELQREVRRLEKEIQLLDVKLAAIAAEEAQKNSWTAWLLSPIYTKVEDSEEEKARKDRNRQEDEQEKRMKERRLSAKSAALMNKESVLSKAKEEVDAADRADNLKIYALEGQIWARESRERQERDRVEKARLAKIRQQEEEEKRKRAMEKEAEVRKRQAEMRAAEQKRQDELEAFRRKQQAEQERQRSTFYNSDFYATMDSTSQSFESCCIHDGWWDKVQGRTACPKCFEVWTYLLQCPNCKMKACPKCQADIRRRLPRGGRRTNRRAHPTMNYHDYYD